MVNRLTHDGNGKRLNKFPPELVTAEAVATKPRQHVGARKNKLAPDFEIKPRQFGINAPALSREYEVLKELVRSDHQRIKNMPDDTEKKKREKSRLLNQYRDYLTQWIAAGERHNNDVLFFNVVWAADVGEWTWLLTLTDYAVETGQVIDIFKSTPDSIAAREIYYAADRATKDAVAIPDCFFIAFEKSKTGHWKIPNALLAKYYKLAGILKHESGLDFKTKSLIDVAMPCFETAKKYYEQAELLDKKAGCKGRLKEVTDLLTSPATNITTATPDKPV